MSRELQEAREQLLAAERLALIGRFAGNISHEIRNPLGVISNSANFLDKLLAGSDQARVHKHLGIIQRTLRKPLDFDELFRVLRRCIHA